ncbi:hypothetical protein W97_02210 [Coniosporium apollinis CBS 100218]|uniref:Uncharacterized protein n=1 Tax=Coniosporium apollinis (strain CBS 100218) TaxID=1168221 RepID=R7YME2_CONA1|nr:uncharacterized protein W97_02210 [Coniosporium apollinis CBS 100218]EON62984.1 hypothetical protein W97_02210 [Coniosporium apollinis CBS 100218]
MVLVELHSVIDLYGALLAFQLKAARPTCPLRQAGVRCQHAAQLAQKLGFNATKKTEDTQRAKHPATLSVENAIIHHDQAVILDKLDTIEQLNQTAIMDKLNAVMVKLDTIERLQLIA